MSPLLPLSSQPRPQDKRLLFHYIPEGAASQELGSSKEMNSKSQRSESRKPWCTLAILTFCYRGCADLNGNWSGPARLREPEGQLVNQLCCIIVYSTVGPKTVPYMDPRLRTSRPSDSPQGSSKIASWDEVILPSKRETPEKLLSMKKLR